MFASILINIETILHIIWIILMNFAFILHII